MTPAFTASPTLTRAASSNWLLREAELVHHSNDFPVIRETWVEIETVESRPLTIRIMTRTEE